MNEYSINFLNLERFQLNLLLRIISQYPFFDVLGSSSRKMLMLVVMPNIFDPLSIHSYLLLSTLKRFRGAACQTYQTTQEFRVSQKSFKILTQKQNKMNSKYPTQFLFAVLKSARLTLETLQTRFFLYCLFHIFELIAYYLNQLLPFSKTCIKFEYVS